MPHPCAPAIIAAQPRACSSRRVTHRREDHPRRMTTAGSRSAMLATSFTTGPREGGCAHDGRPREDHRLDVAITIVLSALGVLLMYDNVEGPSPRRRATRTRRPRSTSANSSRRFAIPLFLLVTVPLLWRRAAPIAAPAGASPASRSTSCCSGPSSSAAASSSPPPSCSPTRRARGSAAATRCWASAALGRPDVDIGIEFGRGPRRVRRRVTAAIWGVGRVVRARGARATSCARAPPSCARRATSARGRGRHRPRPALARARRAAAAPDSASSRGWPTPAPRATDTAAPTALSRRSSARAGSTLEEMRAAVGVAARGHRRSPHRAAADAHPSGVAARPREGRATRG